MYSEYHLHNLICASFPFSSADEVLLKPTGAQLTVEFLEERSFSVPVMVLRRDGLGMNLPPSSFGVNDVEHYIGKLPSDFNSSHRCVEYRLRYICVCKCICTIYPKYLELHFSLAEQNLYTFYLL